MIEQILEKARSQIGVKESPPGSNRVKYCDWYGLVGPWCAMYVSWVYDKAGYPLPKMQSGAPSGAAYCPFVENWARKHGQWHKSPKPGDLALFHFGKSLAVHIGIVETVSGNSFTCLEGNTSVASNDNGGAVMRRNRNVAQCRGFYRPANIGPEKTGKNAYYRFIYLKDPEMAGNDIKQWQRQMNYFQYGLDVDGEYGTESEKACRDLQQKRGLTVDGVIGPETWRETWERD